MRTCAACGIPLVQREGWRIVSGRKNRIEADQSFANRQSCDENCRALLLISAWGSQWQKVSPALPSWKSSPGPRNYASLWR